MCPEFNQSIVKYKVTTEIMKLNLDIKNVGGLGSKQQRKLICMKVNVSKIHGKVQVG